MAVAFPRQLGAVADQETGVAGEFVRALRNDLYGQFLGDDFSAGGQPFVQCVRFVQLG